jgi:glutaredoxin
MLTLWQAEWCPYSARVRQALTELGVDFVARQVAAEKEERGAMREETGKDEIPLLVLEDGTQIDDWKQAIAHLHDSRPRPGDADRHREKSFEEAKLRDPNRELT